MIEILHQEIIYLWYYFSVQLEQLFSYWVLGMVIGSAASVFLKDKIHNTFRTLGEKKMGVFGIVVASILGIASPLCMYGTIPISASFSKSGMKDDWLAAFMMSSILLNPQLIIYSAALGHVALLVRILLSALFQRYVPTELMTRLFGGNEAFGVFMAATIGVPLYACGGGTIPLLQAWMYDGMSMGSAAAFMITGPATKITNLGAVKIILGTKRFLLYVSFAMLFSLICGGAVNMILH